MANERHKRGLGGPLAAGPIGRRSPFPMQQRQPEEQASFEKFSASELYCPKCKQSMPVREKFLLHLPGGDLHDYLCARCGTSVGTRTGR